TYRWRSQAYLELKDDKRAVADLSSAIEADTREAASLIARAAIYLRQKEFDKVLDDCKAALRLDNSLQLDSMMIQAYVGRGQAYLASGDPKKAAHCFTEATLLDRNNEDALLGLGDAHRDLKDWGQAVESYTAAWVKKPTAAAVGQRLHAAYDGQF